MILAIQIPKLFIRTSSLVVLAYYVEQLFSLGDSDFYNIIDWKTTLQILKINK